MWHKFQGPTYADMAHIDAAIENCSTMWDLGLIHEKLPRCWIILNCGLDAANANQQAQFSAAATILGLLPTALSMISISADDLIQIHCRLPVLALLLSIANPSTIARTLGSEPTKIHPFRTKRSPGLKKLLSHGIQMPFNIHIPLPFWFHDFILYALATGCAIMMLYQALMLGLRGVLVFGCWSWYLPFLWVSAAGFCHFVYVITWRLCLGPASRPLEKHWTRWLFSISRSSLNLTVVRPRVARFLALLFQTSGLMNYAFGTVILSGMTLVNPHIAQRITLLMLLSGLVAKVIALWLLDIYPDVEAEQVKGSEWKGEETQILAKSSPIRGM